MPQVYMGGHRQCRAVGASPGQVAIKTFFHTFCLELGSDDIGFDHGIQAFFIDLDDLVHATQVDFNTIWTPRIRR